MVSDLRIYIAIGLFMIICASLLIFNLAIIHYTKSKNDHTSKRVEKWKELLYKQSDINSENKIDPAKHEKYLRKSLSNPENLLAFSAALQYIKSEFPLNYIHYIKSIYPAFQQLANKYGRMPSVERAFFADFICNFPQLARGGMYDHLLDTLISYINGSEIHCRLNVLRALNSIGSTQGVERALRIIENESLFMHEQLLGEFTVSDSVEIEAIEMEGEKLAA